MDTVQTPYNTQSLVIEPTAMAQWHHLVSDAEAHCHCHIGETLQSYLVFLLMRFLKRTDIVHSILALEFLQASADTHPNTPHQHYLQWREIGDKCLLLAGLFPALTERRRVNASYFIELGRSAYYQLAITRHEQASLYSELVQAFVKLRDILQTLRELDGRKCLSPLAALSLWEETGSPQALQNLQAITAQPGIIPAFSRSGVIH